LIEIEMPDLPETNTTRSSAKRRWPRMPIVAGLIVLLFALAVCFLPYWFEAHIRRGREAYTRREMADVKAGRITSLFDPAATVLEEIVEDRECADKITEVYIGEFAGPHFTGEQFRELKRLPHLKTVRVMYVGQGDSILVNIQGMATIEELSFYHAGVTAEGARHLTSFPHLKELTIDRVDDEMLEEIKKLKKTLPTCRIHWQPLTEDEREMLRKRD
jgi:hypothetical protein